MSESFAELFNESLKTINTVPGSIVLGVVTAIDDNWVTVHVGLKSEGVIPRAQFLNPQGELEVAVDDEVEVALEVLEDGWGETRLSRDKAKRVKTWKRLEKAHESQEIVKGVVSSKVKGGFTVEIGHIRAFLPGSLIDVRPLRDTSHLEGKELEFKVIKLDSRRNNVVVSRRAVLEAENSAEREALLENLHEGATVKGVVKNLTDYGAFVDLGGVDGLLHITDMAWKRIKHPGEVVNVGDEISVRVLKFDRDRKRVSLGLKQLGEDPWHDIVERYPIGTKAKSVVTNLADYGCFAELEEGVEGLVHVSEMDWANKNIPSSKVVNVGDEVEVMVLDIDQERRRISLGIKQCRPNPWEDFAAKYQKGDRVKGTVKTITDFGVFVGLNGEIDGLVHLSDLSWTETGEGVLQQLSKGSEVETIVLSVDAERERISLGIKQLDEDPFNRYITEHSKGDVVTGTVAEVSERALTIKLDDHIEGQIKASEISVKSTKEITEFNVGDEVTAKIVNIDRKNRTLSLSCKAIELDQAGGKKEQEDSRGDKESRLAEKSAKRPKTIGDLIKAQMSSRGSQDTPPST